MSTKCKFKNGMQVFSSTPQMISAGGNVASNQRVHTSIVETVVLTETIYANTLDSTSMSFRVFIAGEISSTGNGDITLTLRYGTTDILALTTVTLANEDDMPFKAEWTGHVLTAGSSGKIVATAFSTFFQGTPMYFVADTANTGATVNLTADGSLNVTAHWDESDADDDIIVTHGWIELYN